MPAAAVSWSFAVVVAPLLVAVVVLLVVAVAVAVAPLSSCLPACLLLLTFAPGRLTIYKVVRIWCLSPGAGAGPGLGTCPVQSPRAMSCNH